jgi:DNA-binding transcriptional MerR regulator
VTESGLLSIGRFARLTGLSIGALRHYDEMGLLPPAAVSAETGYRSYRREQAATALLIARLRDLEMPLPEIRALLAATPAERERRLKTHRDRMEARTFRLHFILHQLNQEEPMSTSATQPETLDADTHRQIGAQLFNHVWSLLETEGRTTEQDDEMLHAAHASRWHWGQTGVPDIHQRLAVGEWQCSRVYAVLGRGEPSLHHARRCVELIDAGGMEDWVTASAYEGMARASRTAGDRAAFEEWRARAHAAMAEISDAEDREVIENDLATLAD